MHPYKRTHKPLRHNQFYCSAWLGRAGKATGNLWKDIHAIWCRDPPFPGSVRILISLVLIWILIMPILYIFVPPLVTAAGLYMLACDEFPTLVPLPPVPATQKALIYKIYKEAFKKASFRISMLVTLYDYMQTFRALGTFQL